MPRRKPLEIHDLRSHPRAWVTPAELAPYLGVPVRTLQGWCQRKLVPGAKRRGIRPDSGDWVISIEGARYLEVRVGLARRAS